MGRRLGQHFLERPSILDRIASAACPHPGGDVVVEIGPGRGALTSALLPRATHVYAIEIDPVLVHYLQQRFRDEPKLTVVPGDVLNTDLSQWGAVTVAGNVPYYITSPIAERVLRLGPLLKLAVFLVQKEVAVRMASGPGSRDYGYLSVQCQLLAEVDVLFTVPPGAFRPPPKVDSAVVRLRPRPEPLVDDGGEFLRFAAAVFQHKRKNLRNNLQSLYTKESIDAQPEAGLRAEQLTVQQLVDLRERLSKSGS